MQEQVTPEQALTLFDQLISQYKGTENDFVVLREGHKQLADIVLQWRTAQTPQEDEPAEEATEEN